MNVLMIALKNLKKNFSFYALYLVSVTFILTIFFAFASFSMNEVMMEKISTDGRVETMTRTISVFLMAFVLFYMSYSNQFFLRRRSKELGVYALLGCRKLKIISLLALENVFICLISLLLGIFLGALAHKGIVAGITKLLELDINNAAISLFNLNAIAYTALFVAVIVVFLLLSNTLTVHKITLLELVKLEKKAEKKIKTKLFFAVGGVVLLLFGYLLAVDIIRGRNSLWQVIGYSPIALLTVLLVTSGTILTIRSFLPWWWRRIENNKSRFYTPTQIITIPNLVYRIQTNAKTLIMLTFLMAGTLIATGAIALSLYYPIMAVERIIPAEIELRMADKNQFNQVSEIIHNYAPEAVITPTTIISATATAEQLPPEYNLGKTPSFECISESAYLALLRAQGKTEIAETLLPLNMNESILVKYELNRDGSTEQGQQYTLMGSHEMLLTVKETTLHNPIGFANSIGTLIVPDKVYNELANSNLPKTQVVSVNGAGADDNDDLWQALTTFLNGSPYLVSSSKRVAQIIYASSSTFLLLGFLVVLFFVASGSILYFNNIAAVTEAKADYLILSRLGYNQAQIKRIISRQVLVFFSTAFLVGLLHSVFALLCYRVALIQNILDETLELYLPVIVAYLVTLVIFGGYYLLTIHSCNRITIRQSRCFRL